jgi:hypothetical protein
MKKLILILILIVNWQLSIDNCYAQAPNSFSYQAVVRNNSGVAMPNQLVNFRISILQGSTSGTAVYTETKQLTTSSGGLADFSVGTGAVVSGTMAGINWGANTHFLKIELDAAGGNNFVLMGTSQLMSVPYALDAKKAEGLQVPFAQTENTTNPTIFITNTGTGHAIIGENTNNSGLTYGVQGTSYSPTGIGVYGYGASNNGSNVGVLGLSSSSDGVGVQGYNTSNTGATRGVVGQIQSATGSGVEGISTSATGNSNGVTGSSSSTTGAGGSFSNSASGGNALVTQQGAVKIGNLSGTGSRMVVAGTDGTLNTQALPSSQWTTNGNDISNTNTGNVGIGSLATTISKLNVSNSTNSNGIASYTYVNGSSAIAGRAVADNSYGVIGQALNNASTGVYGLADNANSVGVLAIAPNATSIGLSANSGFGTAGEFYTQTGTGLHVNAATTGKAIIVENGKSGFGEPNPQEKLDVNGAVKIGNTATNNAGTIKYDGTDLQGYVGGQWKSLTQGGGTGPWIASGNNISNTNTGNIGIGTNNPNSKLHINEDADVWHTMIGGTTGQLLVGGQSLTGAVLQSWNPTTNAARDLYLQRDGGRVGIGTTNPTGNLTVKSNEQFGVDFKLVNNENYDFAILKSSSIGNGTYMGENTANANIIGAAGSGSLLVGVEDDIHFGTVDANTSLTKKVTIKNDGKLGIATSIPQEKLDVNGAVKIGNTTTNNAGTIKYDGTDLQGYVGGQWKSLTQGGGNGPWIASGNNISNTNTGNIGIGTNNPNSKLHINEDADVWHTMIGGTTGQLLVGGQSLTGAVLQSWNPTTNAARDLYLQRDGGRVGIGTTNPTGNLTVKSNEQFGVDFKLVNNENYDFAILKSSSIGNGTYMGENTANANIIGAAGSGSLLVGVEDDIHFGTVDANSSLTKKVTIKNDGKLGIATSIPQEKLDVNGAVKIGNTTTNNAGTIKYDGTDLQGYVGGQWKSLTSGGANYTAGSGIAISGSNVISTIPQTLSIATNQLTLSNGGGTVTLPSTTYTAGTGITVAGSVVSALNTSNIWNANKLQGNNVSATAPTNGQSLVWNNTSSQWEPQTVSGGSSPFSTNGNNAYLTNLSSGTLSVGSNASLPTFKSTIYSDVDNPNGMYISANSGNGIAMMTTGRVGINTLTPYTDAVLDVNGSMYIRGGNPAAGKVLTSNADGKASWQTPTGGVNYTAGTGINISGGNVISATAPTYTAGTGIDITGGTISSNLTAGTGINISGGTVSTNLTAGSGISITGNTISATGSATGGWNKTGANVSLQTSTDYVGIGTAGSAGAKLRIAGGTDAGISVTASGSFNNAIFANVVGTDAVAANLLAASGAKGLVVSSTDANAAQFFSQNSASINVNPTTSTSKIAIVVPFDNSGFGTTTPTDKVHIVGGTSLRYEDGNQAAGKVLTSDANGRASWQTPTGGGGGGSSPWTVTGNDINNSNTGKVLVAEATGTTGAKFEVANNPGGGFGKVAAISTTSNYMTALEVTESSTSGNPAATVGSTGAAAIKASATFGDALFANSTNGRGIFLKGGSTNYPAMKIENNVNATTSLEMDGQIKINGGAPGAGKVLTSDANGLATWQTPSGGGGGGATGWGLTGNSGNSPTTNFIGNTDAVDLVMKTNNVAGLVLTSGGAILASGNTTTGTTPAIGAGTRMMWIPNRAAFRAGAVNGTQWNDINIGFNSAAFGNNCIASGMNSFAAGNSSSAGSNSAISMGSSCSASSSNTVALGNLVSVNQLGAFCFGDQEFANTLMPSTSNEMSMRFKGGYRLFTTSATTGGSAIGVTLAAGGNSWAQISDVRRKENFIPVNGEDFLNKIAQFKLTSWNYKGQDAKSFRHYGPMAQDFYAAFGNDQLGTIGNDTTITSGDFDGINFIAIQALEKRTSDLNNANLKLQQENKILLESIENMKAEMSSQKAELNKKFEMLEAIIENSKIDKNEFITNNK